MIFSENPSYQLLRNAVSERPRDFVAIIGAGVSSQSGLPTWQKLVLLLITDLEKTIKSMKEKGEFIPSPINIDYLKTSTDYWHVMGIIRQFLEPSIFEERIKYHLRYNYPLPPPEILLSLWRLGIKGIISPNLDNLAANAYAKCFGRTPDVSSSTNYKYLEFLGDERNFVFQPHGELGDAKSWVLTYEKLADLLKDDSYRKWWEKLLGSHHLILIGVNEADVSIKTYILNNTSNRKHYLITPIQTEERLHLFKTLGFIHIPYNVKYSDQIEDHSELNELIQDILSFTTKEIIPPAAFSGDSLPISELPSPKELQSYPINAVRTKLNAAVASILPAEGDAEGKSLQDFENLRKQYLFNFMGASAVEPNTEYDQIHGYRVVEKIGEGGFGAVYVAERTNDKKKFAIKVIHPQIIQSGPHLNAFRRGTYAMRILTKRKIDGIVYLENAFEVPFSIVMDLIDGYDLEKAIENKQLSNIVDRLKIVRRVAQIIHSAHCIDEQILHRDIKPGNVLLSGYSYQDINVEDTIRVVDFDLCWHRYATAKTVVHHKGSQGYTAPEIFNPSIGSTRKAWVDVYGLGMLLYFVLKEMHPIPGITSADSFENDFANEILHRWNFSWNSIAGYLARCIKQATILKPELRPSVPDIINMLDVALSFQLGGAISEYLPLIGMELIDPIKKQAQIDLKDFGRKITLTKAQKELELVLEGKEEGLQINLMIRHNKDESLIGEDRDKRDKRVGDRIRQIALKSGCEVDYNANLSCREVKIIKIFAVVNLAEIRKCSNLLSNIWIKISEYY